MSENTTSLRQYLTEHGIPLVYVGMPPAIPVITVENFCEWNSLYAVMPDGSVRKITSDEIAKAKEGIEHAWKDYHNFYPVLMNNVAKLLNGKPCTESYHMVVGRWVMEQMDDPFNFDRKRT